MVHWYDFWNFFFWISLLSFLINPINFFSLLIFSEIVWIILYSYSILIGTLNDDLNLLTLSFLILGLASVEFALGYILIVLFKYFNSSINLIDLENIWYLHIYKNKNNLKILKKTWKIKNNN